MTGSGEDEPEPVGEAEEGPGIVHVGQEPEGAAAHRCPQHAKYKHPECSIGLLCTACRLLPGLLNPNHNGVKYSLVIGGIIVITKAEFLFYYFVFLNKYKIKLKPTRSTKFIFIYS